MVDSRTWLMRLYPSFDAYEVIDSRVRAEMREHFTPNSGVQHTLHPSVEGRSARIEFQRYSFDGSPVGESVVYAFDHDMVVPIHHPRNPNIIESVCLRDAGRHFPAVRNYGPAHDIYGISDVVRAVAGEMAAAQNRCVPSDDMNA